MKRNQVFVRARKADGSFGVVDILNLDDASFRTFITQILFDAGAVVGIFDEHVAGEHIELRERTPIEVADGEA